MRNFAIIFLLTILTLTGFAQKPGNKTTPGKPTPTPTAGKKADENEEFQKARYQPVISERIAALKKFVEDFPESENKTFALELLSSSRAELGDQKLRLSDIATGIELFKLAASEAPSPVSEKLYTQILINLPTNLLYGGQSVAAFEVARIIEGKIGDNVQQILGLAGFYLGTEQASEGKRLAEKAIALEPNSPTAYQTLGYANRIDFELESSVAAYTKALELDGGSPVSKRSLAEMKRATGTTGEAIALYRQILEASPDDRSARDGLILSLFDAGQRAEAEAEMTRAFETNPENLFLLVGAAYWYAAHNEGAKAVELAEKAVAFEPRYTWAHIALARGLIQQKKPLDAERTLLIARQYGNFPTLNYEIAAARLAAGLFREASDELRKNFSYKDGAVSTKLGGRIPKEGKSFIELLGFERRASIFQPLAADNPETAEKLKDLLKFSQTLDETDELKINEAVDEFVRGDDKMKIHRRLYAAQRLLEKRIAAAKALEMTTAAIGEVNTALDVTVPSAAVMADELYENRTVAITRNELLIIPEVPLPTLSKILRGRIEELTGWALFQQEKTGEAVIRLKRAVNVLPENSAWWRSSQWRLGSALEADGKPQDALNAFLAGYNKEAPDPIKRIVIESLYQKINGSTEGLDRIMGAKPNLNIQASEVSETETAVAVPTPETNIKAETTPTPAVSDIKIPDNVPFLKEGITTPTPTPTPTPQPEADQENLKIPENVPAVEASPTPQADEKPKDPTEILPETVPSPTPDPSVTAQNISATKSEPASDEPKLPENNLPAESKAEVKQTEKTENSDQKSNPVQNLLFEPIIINVPDNKPPKPENTVTGPPEAKPDESKTDEAKPVETPPENPENSATTRPRIVPEAKNETVPPAKEITECRLSIGQEKIAILNDGGSLGMFVGFEGKGDLSKIEAKSDSPKDVSVLAQSDVGVLSDRLFFIIKSISPKIGDFTVKFDSPCGKKEITVTVR